MLDLAKRRDIALRNGLFVQNKPCASRISSACSSQGERVKENRLILMKYPLRSASIFVPSCLHCLIVPRNALNASAAM